MDHGEARPQPCPGPEAWYERALTPSSSLAADERLDLEDGRWEDVHVITGALKLFFRELPEPLFPFSHFRQFIAAISEWGGGGGVQRACLGQDPHTAGVRSIRSPRRAHPSLRQSCRTRPSAAALCAAWCTRCPPPTTTPCGCSSSICAGEWAAVGMGTPPHTHTLPSLGPDPPPPHPRCRVIEYGEQNRMSVQSVAIVFGPTLLRPETEEASMPMTMVFQNQVVELILQQCSDIFPPH